MDKIKFNKNGRLTVMQISDAQDFQWVRKTMIRMLDKACDIVKPDLIIFTGDNILGNHIRDRRFFGGERRLDRNGEFASLKKALGNLLCIPEKKKIPFVAIYGNHDDRNAFTKDEQADIYRNSPMNRGFVNGGELCGTDCIPVYSADGSRKVMNFWMIDTARQDKETGKCIESVTKATADWFRGETAKQKNENDGNAYPGVMFMHIPFAVSLDLIEECEKEDATAGYDGKYYKLKDGAKGELGEYIAPVSDEYGLYDALADSGVHTVVSGHDHLNCYEADIDGLRFIATPGASFRSYGNKHTRGVRVFEFSKEHPGRYGTYTLNHKDILGDTPLTALRYFWDADDMEYKKAAVLAAAALGTTIASLITVIRKKL